jgi:hypothetical protein
MAAIFRDYRQRGGVGDEDIATLHFRIGVDEQFEQNAWGMLSDVHEKLEAEIREAVSETLGPEYTVSWVLYTQGSIDILIGVGAAAYAVYVGASRYKNFIESLTILVRQLRSILKRFFGGTGPAPVVVTGTWIPGPTLQQQGLGSGRAGEFSPFRAVLWYLIISHAALLAVVIWRVLR